MVYVRRGIMERDESILQYNATNPLLGCVMSRVAKRVVTLEKMMWYPIWGNILCEFSYTEHPVTYISGDRYPKLVSFIKRFGRTLY